LVLLYQSLGIDDFSFLGAEEDTLETLGEG
jgi:hypothetical protein